MIDQLQQDVKSVVIFRLGSEEYGLAIERVQSIIRFEASTPVPRAPDIVMGVINLRGQVIPVVDLTLRFLQESFQPSPTSRIIVAEGEVGVLGLAVDSASEVVSIPLASIKPAPESVLTTDTATAFEGVAEYGGNLVILIDLDRAVPRVDYARLAGDSEPEGGSDV